MIRILKGKTELFKLRYGFPGLNWTEKTKIVWIREVKLTARGEEQKWKETEPVLWEHKASD